jgi:DICT domain-containing protein
MFGPAGVIDDAATAWSMPSDRNVVEVESRSPFEVVTQTLPSRTARKDTLVAFSRHIETQASHAADPPMLMAALQRGRHLTRATHACYQDLATKLPLVSVFGVDLPEDPGSGLRYVPLASSDPLCREWAVVMLGPHTAAALSALEHDQSRAEGVPDHERRFDLVMTHDRALVTSCARSLLDRMR